MSEKDDPDRSALSPARGLAGLIVANVSLIVAVMVYMGWAYDNSFFEYFHLNALDLGVSVQDYLLRSLSLFNPIVVVVAVAVIISVAAGTRAASLTSAAIKVIRWAASLVRTSPRLRWLNRMIPQGILERLTNMKSLWKPKVIMACLGAAMTVTALVLYSIAADVPVSTYLVLLLLAVGPLLLTSALRSDRQGRVPYSLAIIVFMVCGLWAGSLYASGLGTRAAQNLVAHLSTETEVAVYSTQSLALSGPQVSVQKLPAGFMYHYRYEGLRLLYMSSGTYYLLPMGWIPQLPLTYIVDTTDQTRIELY
jgi:hypothetical protein